jgi:ATP-dependent DNA ligase
MRSFGYSISIAANDTDGSGAAVPDLLRCLGGVSQAESPAMRLTELPDAPQIDALRAMLLDKRKHPPFDSPDWALEVKYDGWRMLAQFGDGAPTVCETGRAYP